MGDYIEGILEILIIVMIPLVSLFICANALLKMTMLFLHSHLWILCAASAVWFAPTVSYLSPNTFVPGETWWWLVSNFRFGTTISFTFFSGLEIIVVLLIFHWDGYIRLSIKRLNILDRTCSAPFFFRWSFLIRSTPEATSALFP